MSLETPHCMIDGVRFGTLHACLRGLGLSVLLACGILSGVLDSESQCKRNTGHVAACSLLCVIEHVLDFESAPTGTVALFASGLSFSLCDCNGKKHCNCCRSLEVKVISRQTWRDTWSLALSCAVLITLCSHRVDLLARHILQLLESANLLG